MTKKWFIFASSILMLLPEAVLACEKCFGAKGANTQITDGIGFAMLLLLSITAFVMVGIVSFAIYMTRRIRMVESGQIVVTEQGNLLTHPGLLKEMKDFNDKGV